ncbi:MAG: pyridoxamine 5'-phosphate oxidase family protein [Thaumarchaeota archaeon]|nr:pyridoxamine 5'-phosphate oxidase family protein [Nitrososphaerota archaeon]
MNVTFTKKETMFLESLEECRMATSHEDIPHVKPVSFVLYNNTIYIATDYDTRAFKNLKKNPKIAISIDEYVPGAHRAICIQGDAKILEKGKEFLEIYNVFYKKFEWVRNQPWKEGEAPFIKIILTSKSSWGLK